MHSVLYALRQFGPPCSLPTKRKWHADCSAHLVEGVTRLDGLRRMDELLLEWQVRVCITPIQTPRRHRTPTKEQVGTEQQRALQLARP
eukprot:CAMPEP_0183591018 /NCGR_PEP_ID=MMETSP0371-20130417/165490_1 /TAXON_ID=268820 /ORGANISM="Peridinium aciculiferum, Strain PAER-2" /LENGTH=87 /DNA_ID=CAMNT_0025802463 /DNA_START=310 /DNA_END=569 /DNA_ORIENTATION=+